MAKRFSRGVSPGARRALKRLVDTTKDGTSLTITAGRHKVRIADGKVQPNEEETSMPKRKSGDAEADAPALDGGGNATTVAADRLRSFVERVERLEEEKAVIAGDLKEVYAEAKGEGYDTKTLRSVIRERKKDRAERQEQLSMFDLYWGALGEA